MAYPDFLVFGHLRQFPGLVHGVFTRAGGNSTGRFSGLNLGMNCGDDPEIVRANRADMLAALGVSNALFLNQVHGEDILVLERGSDIRDLIWNAEAGKTHRPASADAVVTDVEDLALVIQVADCQAVIFYDPVRRVIANVHSGWRGSVANILGRCLDVMTGDFHCRTENIFVGISPSLGPCCAEFRDYRTWIPRPLWKYMSEDRPYVDFWEMSRAQLVENGINPDHIQSMELCTKCNADRFYSYRANKTTGRFGAVVGLVSTE